MRDEIIRMAKEVGFEQISPFSVGTYICFTDEIERFYNLAVQHEREFYDDLLHGIKSWSEAYPLEVFPEPDFEKAHEVLKANGMTIDAISASNMRHVITQVQAMIDQATRARGEKK